MTTMLPDAGFTCVFTDSEFSIRSPDGKGFYLDGYNGPKNGSQTIGNVSTQNTI